MAAHGSSIAALQSSLTTGLSNKADQSAFDVLEGVVATKSTPDSVDLKAVQYTLPRHSGEDHAAGGRHQGGQRSPGGRHHCGAGLRACEQRRLHLGAAGLQGGRHALQSAVDTSSVVDSIKDVPLVSGMRQTRAVAGEKVLKELGKYCASCRAVT